MNVHALLKLPNELRTKEKIEALPSILLNFQRKFNNFNNAEFIF